MAATASTAMAKPMQFRMSTRSMVRHGGSGIAKTQLENRNRYASTRMYPARRKAATYLRPGDAWRRSWLSIWKARVTPASSRKSGAAMPPTNCEST